MITSGRLLATITKTLGAPLVGDHTAGATTLTVARTVDFSADGGWLQLGADTLRYATIDRYAKTVTLTDPLTADAFTDDWVAVWDPDLLRVATELECQVAPDGDDDTADPIFAEVEHQLQPYLPTGILDAPYPVVTLERFEDGWIVTGGPRAETPQLDGQAVWNPHSFRVVPGKTIPDSVITQVNGWNDVETDGISFATATWTILTDGWYTLSAAITWVQNIGGRRALRVYLNGALLEVDRRGPEPDNVTDQRVSTERRLKAGDAITVWAYQNSGAALDITSGTCSIHRLSV